MIKLRDYQEESINEIRTALTRYRSTLFQLTTGGGKCLGRDTPILMYDGTIKKVQDVEEGDILMGDDSHPRIVESVCTGKEEMYRIIPNKGEHFECNGSHILSLRYCDKKHGYAKRDISINEYFRLGSRDKHLLKLYRASIEFEEKELPIDPYVLGLWLADGSKKQKSPIFTINKDDKEITDYLLSLGGRYYSHDKRDKNCHTISLARIHNPNGKRKNSSLYHDEFKKCIFDDTNDIGIPYEYKVNSYRNRMLLLAGLLDGDGYTNGEKCGYEIITKYKRLKDDILYLCRSLGFAAYCHVKRVDLSKVQNCVSKDVRDYFRITISGFCEDIPLKSSRKSSAPRKMNKNVLNVGFNIEPLGVGDYYGFEISGNNRRFLLGDFTVTHNTVIFSSIANSSQKYGRKVLIMSNRTEIMKQNGGALSMMGLSVEYISPKNRSIPSGNIAVGMSQTLRRRVSSSEAWRDYVKSIELLIVDEAHCCDHDFIYDYVSESCFRLLVTATPRRQGNQKQLGLFAKSMVTGIKTKDLIRRGYLTPARHYSVAAPQLDDVEIDSGTKEFNQRSLAAKYEDKTLYRGVIDEWFRLCRDKKTLVFCVSSVQAIDFTKMLVERGVAAKYALSGSFEDDAAYSGERNELFESFKRGDFQVLVNVGIAVAGTDIPDIECIVANFATTSMCKWRQAIGRGCRISEGKNEFVILDAGNNIKRLGFFESDIEWSLWHDVSKGGGLQVMKDCPTDKIDINHKNGCGARIPASCKICPCCGFKFPTDKDVFQLHLEEVSESDEDNLVSWSAKKKLEGWTMNRILVQCCLSNIGNEKKAFKNVYMALYPEKGESDADKYWYVFRKHIWSKIKTRSSKDKESLKDKVLKQQSKTS